MTVKKSSFTKRVWIEKNGRLAHLEINFRLKTIHKFYFLFGLHSGYFNGYFNIYDVVILLIFEFGTKNRSNIIHTFLKTNIFAAH